jgi:hypothetical protein
MIIGYHQQLHQSSSWYTRIAWNLHPQGFFMVLTQSPKHSYLWGFQCLNSDEDYNLPPFLMIYDNHDKINTTKIEMI